MIGEIPLVSRTVQLDRIVSKLRGDVPAAFVLAGAAGVGKTRLAAEAARAAARLGYATAQVVATRAASSIPFGPFAAFLPELGPTPGGLLGLLRQATESIVKRAGNEQRLLLVVDDGHLLDDGSAALVHQLVGAASCSMVVTVRTPGGAPDPVTALWKDDLADRIDLDPLAEPDVEELAAGVLGGPVAGASVRRLWEASGGNALYIRELLMGAADSGAVAEVDGVWTLRLPLTASDRLVELVALRLTGLAPETAGVIELLAAGEPLGLQLLENLTAR